MTHLLKIRVLFLILFLILLTYSCIQRTKVETKDLVDTLTQKKAGTFIKTADTAKSGNEDRDYGIKHLDDPSKPNIIIDNFNAFIEKSVKVSLPTDSRSPQLSNPDERKEYFITRSFFEKYLNNRPLIELLNKKDKEKSWAGYETEIRNTANEYFTIKEADEVIKISPLILLENNAGVWAFSYSQWNLPSVNFGQYSHFGNNVVIFDSTGNYIGGFESDYSDGNAHGATHIRTLTDRDIRFHATITAWHDATNPKGFQINTTFEIQNNKLKRISYKKSKQ